MGQQENTISIEVLAERVESLRCDIQEIKAIFEQMAKERRAEYKTIIALSNSTTRAHERIDDLVDWRKSVDKFMPVVKAVAWICSLMTLPFLLWLISVVWQWVLLQVR